MPLQEFLPVVSSPVLLLKAVFLYSFIVAAFLPFPTETVLVVPLLLVSPWYVSFPLVVLVAALGKAAGSLITLRIGYGIGSSGPVARLFERVPQYRRFKRVSLLEFVRRYRYLGLGVAISIPLLPETTTLYAFSVLDNRPVLFRDDGVRRDHRPTLHRALAGRGCHHSYHVAPS